MTSIAAFLDRVPDEYVLADPEELDGQVTAPTDDEAASGPAERAQDLLADGDEVDLLTPVVANAYVAAIKRTVLAGGAIDVVATGDAATALDSGGLAAVRPMLAMRENVTVQVHDGDAPFAVLVRPDVVAFAIADDAGRIDLLFESRGDEARSWARDVLAVYREEAESL